MYGGSESARGLSPLFGYLVFAVGAAVLWSNRNDVPVWVHDEMCAFRRKFVWRASFVLHSDLATGGSLSILREEHAFRSVPSRFRRTLAQLHRRRINQGAILLFVGPLLTLLDWLI